MLAHHYFQTAQQKALQAGNFHFEGSFGISVIRFRALYSSCNSSISKGRRKETYTLEDFCKEKLRLLDHFIPSL